MADSCQRRRPIDADGALLGDCTWTRRSSDETMAKVKIVEYREVEGVAFVLPDAYLDVKKRNTEIQAVFRTDEIRRTAPTPPDEMRAGMSYFHETIRKGVPEFLRRVDTALKNTGINERVPYNAPLIQFSSWMGGDRNGNPRVTPEVTRDACLLTIMTAANLYFSQIEDLMFELSMWCCSDELRVRVEEIHRSSRKDAKHYIVEL
ncbi:Phosphoenolpyruvate carboxylase 2-like protein [Drosera capensis]